MPSVTVSVKMEGAARLEARIVGIEERFPAAPAKMVREASQVLEGALRSEAPKRTGRLAAEVDRQLEAAPFFARATFTDRAPYTPFVIEGTRPHRIFPLAKQALWWKGALHPVWGDRATRRGGVSHPGTHANPFNVRGFRAALPVMKRLVREIAREILG